MIQRCGGKLVPLVNIFLLSNIISWNLQEVVSQLTATVKQSGCGEGNAIRSNQS